MTEDFTLEINPAKFVDTSSEYHCVVSVDDPQIGSLTYTRSMTVNITLTVLSEFVCVKRSSVMFHV